MVLLYYYYSNHATNIYSGNVTLQTIIYNKCPVGSIIHICHTLVQMSCLAQVIDLLKPGCSGVFSTMPNLGFVHLISKTHLTREQLVECMRTHLIEVDSHVPTQAKSTFMMHLWFTEGTSPNHHYLCAGILMLATWPPSFTR